MACCAAAEPLWIGADNDVSYTGARRRRTGTYLNEGTCTWSLYASDDLEAPIATGTLDYDAGSDGNYYGVIESTETEDLTAGATYYIVFSFSQATFHDRRKISTLAEERS